MPNRKNQMLTDCLFTVSKRSHCAHCTYSTGRRYGEHPLWPTKAQNTNAQLKKIETSKWMRLSEGKIHYKKKQRIGKKSFPCLWEIDFPYNKTINKRKQVSKTSVLYDLCACLTTKWQATSVCKKAKIESLKKNWLDFLFHSLSIALSLSFTHSVEWNETEKKEATVEIRQKGKWSCAPVPSPLNLVSSACLSLSPSCRGATQVTTPRQSSRSPLPDRPTARPPTQPNPPTLAHIQYTSQKHTHTYFLEDFSAPKINTNLQFSPASERVSLAPCHCLLGWNCFVVDLPFRQTLTLSVHDWKPVFPFFCLNRYLSSNLFYWN